jgi:hypothetical protein
MLLTAAFALTGFIATQTGAMAQNTTTCTIVDGCKVLVVLDPCGNVISTQTDCGSTGSGTFSGPDIPAKGPLNLALTPESISATVQDPVYGEINTTLDPDRPSEASTIITTDRAAAAGDRFPAAGVIRFNANATISSAPGIVYASRTPLELRNDNLQSFNPFKNEKFEIKEEVEFYNTADLSQSTAFRLSAGSSVTLGSGDAGNGPQVPGDIH